MSARANAPSGGSLSGLLALSRAIDRMNTAIGRTAAWLVLAAVLVSTANAVIRKTLDTSSNAWLELQWYMFGGVFMLCAAWTLLSNEHIRIDIVNSRLGRRARNGIELVGHVLFLIPFCLLMIRDSWPFVLTSYRQGEQSMNAGGLTVWPAKALILIGFVLLLAQGVSELIKRIAIMRGDLPDDMGGGGHHAAAEAEAERLLRVAKEQGLVTEPAAAGVVTVPPKRP
jgi:TRAP-type mannitol/chloroaromatic compound transport system permease small subunit